MMNEDAADASDTNSKLKRKRSQGHGAQSVESPRYEFTPDKVGNQGGIICYQG